jgi:thymidylate kinase
VTNRIYVLEGLNGVGKSALSKVVSERLGVPILRAFRNGNTDVHLGRDGDRRQDRLRAMGVPANTFVDEIYMADFLAATKIGAVLDRSIGSAIAFGLAYGDMKNIAHAKTVAAEWCNIMSRLPVVYVHLTATETVRRERSKGRWRPGTVMEKKLEESFGWVYQELITVTRRTFDVSDSKSPDEAFGRLHWAL